MIYMHQDLKKQHIDLSDEVKQATGSFPGLDDALNSIKLLGMALIENQHENN